MSVVIESSKGRKLNPYCIYDFRIVYTAKSAQVATNSADIVQQICYQQADIRTCSHGL